MIFSNVCINNYSNSLLYELYWEYLVIQEDTTQSLAMSSLIMLDYSKF